MKANEAAKSRDLTHVDATHTHALTALLSQADKTKSESPSPVSAWLRRHR